MANRRWVNGGRGHVLRGMNIAIITVSNGAEAACWGLIPLCRVTGHRGLVSVLGSETRASALTWVAISNSRDETILTVITGSLLIPLDVERNQ
jgi:hypothetical protein